MIYNVQNIIQIDKVGKKMRNEKNMYYNRKIYNQENIRNIYIYIYK